MEYSKIGLKIKNIEDIFNDDDEFSDITCINLHCNEISTLINIKDISILKKNNKIFHHIHEINFSCNHFESIEWED